MSHRDYINLYMCKVCHWRCFHILLLKREITNHFSKICDSEAIETSKIWYVTGSEASSRQRNVKSLVQNSNIRYLDTYCSHTGKTKSKNWWWVGHEA